VVYIIIITNKWLNISKYLYSRSLCCSSFAPWSLRDRWSTTRIWRSKGGDIIYILREGIGEGWARRRKRQRQREGLVLFLFSPYYRNRIQIRIWWSASSPIIYIFARSSRQFKGLSMRPCGIDAKLFDLFLHRFSVSRRVATESQARRARVDLSNIITRRHVYRVAHDRVVRTVRTWMDSSSRLRN